MASNVFGALNEACDRVHASCNEGCPVFLAYGEIPDTIHDFEMNRGCDCFRDGRAMAVVLKHEGVRSVTLDGTDWDLPDEMFTDTHFVEET